MIEYIFNLIFIFIFKIKFYENNFTVYYNKIGKKNKQNDSELNYYTNQWLKRIWRTLTFNLKLKFNAFS